MYVYLQLLAVTLLVHLRKVNNFCYFVMIFILLFLLYSRKTLFSFLDYFLLLHCWNKGSTIPVYPQFRLRRHTYLWPLGIKLTSLFSIIQSCLVLSQFEKSCWTVTIKDAVLWVSMQGVAVQMNSRLKVTTLTCLIALLHFVHELCFAETIPGPVISSNAPDRPARCPRTEDWELEKQTERNDRAMKHSYWKIEHLTNRKSPWARYWMTNWIYTSCNIQLKCGWILMCL